LAFHFFFPWDIHVMTTLLPSDDETTNGSRPWLCYTHFLLGSGATLGDFALVGSDFLDLLHFQGYFWRLAWFGYSDIIFGAAKEWHGIKVESLEVTRSLAFGVVWI
jgi:hypothetical protein